MTIPILPGLVVVFVLVFARIGTMTMLMPGLGERQIPVRMRLAAALLLTLVFLPLARPLFSVENLALTRLLVLLAGELAVGFLLGITGRLLLSSLQTAGVTITNQLGLGFAQTVDPSQGQAGMIVSSFLSITGVTLIFATDLHHLVLGALAESYRFFRPGALPEAGDALRLVLDVAAATFRIGVQLSAPFLVFGLVFNIGLGVLARLMPQLQVFFIAMPLTILGGLVLLAVLFSALMGGFQAEMAAGLARLSGR